MNDRLHVQQLFSRYYQGQATAAEQDELMGHLRSGEYSKAIEEVMKESWLDAHEPAPFFQQTESEAMLSSILASTRKRKPQGRMRLLWMSSAAAAAMLLIAGGVWYKQQKQQDAPAAASGQVQDVLPGGDKALLTLADGSGIELDKVGSGIVARQGNAEITKKQHGVLVYSSGGAGASSANGFNKVSTPRGGQYQIHLPDGSKVWLNASSSIRFPSSFSAAERIVEIAGEAYFEVKKDSKRPFTVCFNGSAVQVLGTSFNIMAYPDEGASKTTLVEGSVSIRHQGEQARLRPGQQAAVSPTGHIRTAFRPVEEAVAWKNGLFYFKNAGIEDVMRQLARWYDVQVSYRDQVPLRQFTGQISRDVKLSEIISMLRFAGVNCSLENKTILVGP